MTALAAAFHEASPALRRYLRARGATDVEDLLQELWLKVQGADADHVEEPLPYLYRMAHNLMLDRIRERRRRSSREQAYQDVHFGAEAAGLGASAERTLIARERLSLIDEALAALGPRTDLIFRRHRIDKVPQQELARELGVTLSAIEKHLQKAYRAVAAAQQRYLDQADSFAGDERHER